MRQHLLRAWWTVGGTITAVGIMLTVLGTLMCHLGMSVSNFWEEDDDGWESIPTGGPQRAAQPQHEGRAGDA